MDDAASRDLLRIANQSGFPFQIGVRREIERTQADHGWKITAEEHPWSHQGGRSGFIDLIAEHDPYFFSLILECKRVRAKDPRSGQGPSWVFLTPREYAASRLRLSGFMAYKLDDGKPLDPAESPKQDRCGWADAVDFQPETPEASYCLFESQDEKNPALERIADTLLPSVEAVGRQWFSFGDVYSGERRVFLPVIVTNATLFTCTFDASTITLGDGCLPQGDFQQVPFIRFRKGLALQQPGRGKARNFADANRRWQRTVLVVNAACLSAFLKALDVTKAGERALWDDFQRLDPA